MKVSGGSKALKTQRNSWSQWRVTSLAYLDWRSARSLCGLNLLGKNSILLLLAGAVAVAVSEYPSEFHPL